MVLLYSDLVDLVDPVDLFGVDGRADTVGEALEALAVHNTEVVGPVGIVEVVVAFLDNHKKEHRSSELKKLLRGNSSIDR